jgi:hypothetical protein
VYSTAFLLKDPTIAGDGIDYNACKGVGEGGGGQLIKGVGISKGYFHNPHLMFKHHWEDFHKQEPPVLRLLSTNGINVFCCLSS